MEGGQVVMLNENPMHGKNEESDSVYKLLVKTSSICGSHLE